MVECSKCGSDAIKFGFKKGIQRYQCRKCKHVFLQKSASSLGASTSLREEASERKPQPQEQEYDQPQDYAEEIIREHEKPKPEPEPEPKRQYNPKEWNSPSIIGDYIAENLGGLVANILNETVFKGKDKDKKKPDKEDLDFI